MLKRIIGKVKKAFGGKEPAKWESNDTRMEDHLQKWGQAIADRMRGKKFSRSEGRLDAQEYAVKSKLGNSFFTRQQPERTRNARISALTSEERRIARARGWIS